MGVSSFRFFKLEVRPQYVTLLCSLTNIERLALLLKAVQRAVGVIQTIQPSGIYVFGVTPGIGFTLCWVVETGAHAKKAYHVSHG